MYKKINSLVEASKLTVGTILVQFTGSDNEGHFINRGTAEHYQVSRVDESKSSVELSIPDDEVPDGPIYVSGKPVTGILHNEPLMEKSFQQLYDENVWWSLST